MEDTESKVDFVLVFSAGWLQCKNKDDFVTSITFEQVRIDQDTILFLNKLRA
jgi:hypothetical protein